MKRLSALSRIEQVLNRIRSASARSAASLVAERLEHPLHPLGVVLVHLAPERGDVIALAAHAANLRRTRWSTSRSPTSSSDHVAVLTYDRPEQRNAVSRRMNAELHHAWRRFRDDDDAFVLVITGTGDAFCAGWDLQDAADWPRPEWDEFRTHVYDSAGDCGYTRRVDVFKPVIAAVNGWAVAAGLENALLADIRIVARNAVFGALERRWNIVAGRRDDGAPAAGRRLREGDGADHHRAAGGRRGGAARSGSRTRSSTRARRCRGRSSWPARSPPCPRGRSAPTRRRWSATSGAPTRSGCATRSRRRCRCSGAATRTRSAPRPSSAARRPSGRNHGL